MSNEPIYPLDERKGTDSFIGEGPRRSVNERLAPIFQALADDPDGWEFEWLFPWAAGWVVPPENFIPSSHDGCNNFRLVPKRRTITVEIDEPLSVTIKSSEKHICRIECGDAEQAKAALNQIRKAMEEQG